MPIPKTVFTMWLNDNPELPPLVQTCIASQKIQGYEHRLITLESPEWEQVLSESRYMRECAPTKRWVKASDYFRIWLLWKYGGIFLDSDMEILPGKNFDDMLDCRMWVPWEFMNFLGNSGLASEAGHPVLKRYLEMVDENFRGDGDLIFQVGMTVFNDVLYLTDKKAMGIHLYGSDYFFPYKHSTGEVNITDNTRVYHHYQKSWNVPRGI